MASLKVDSRIISKLLNHSDVGVTGRVYDWYDYMPEKREAIELLSNHYQELGLKI